MSLFGLEELIAEMRKHLASAQGMNPNNYELTIDFATASLMLSYLVELKSSRDSKAGRPDGKGRHQRGFDYHGNPGFDSAWFDQFYENFRGGGRKFTEEEFTTFWSSNFGRGQGTYSNAAPPPSQKTGKRPWYEVLGVPASANRKAIKDAWRKLTSKYHPDKPENRTPENEERLKEINVAKDEGLAGL